MQYFWYKITLEISLKIHFRLLLYVVNFYFWINISCQWHLSDIVSFKNRRAQAPCTCRFLAFWWATWPEIRLKIPAGMSSPKTKIKKYDFLRFLILRSESKNKELRLHTGLIKFSFKARNLIKYTRKML